MAGWHSRLWRRVKIAPGLTVNLSKSGPSLSLGPRGSKVTFGRRGVRQTIGIPGTGLYATRQLSGGSDATGVVPPERQPGEPAQPASAPRTKAGFATDQVEVYYGMATVVGLLFGLALVILGVPRDQAVVAGMVAVVAGIVYEGLAHHHPGPARAVVAVIAGLMSIATVVLAAVGIILLGGALASGRGRRSRRGF